MLLPPHQSPEDSRTEGQDMSQQEPNPKRQHHHPQHPNLFPAKRCWLYSQWGCSPSHGDINIPHSFSASQMSCKAAIKGRGKDTSELLSQSLSGSQKEGRASSQTAAAKAHPGVLGGFGVGPATSPHPGGVAKLTRWSVEEQGLLSGFKTGNYFSARPSQASSTRHTI